MYNLLSKHERLDVCTPCLDVLTFVTLSDFVTGKSTSVEDLIVHETGKKLLCDDLGFGKVKVYSSGEIVEEAFMVNHDDVSNDKVVGVVVEFIYRNRFKVYISLETSYIHSNQLPLMLYLIKNVHSSVYSCQ